VFQCVGVCYNEIHVAVRFMLQHVAVCCNGRAEAKDAGPSNGRGNDVLQCGSVCSSVLQCVAAFFILRMILHK